MPTDRVPLKGVTPLRSLAEDLYRGLRIPFIPAAELIQLGEFVLVAADTRINRRFPRSDGAPRQEAAFTVQLIEGELAGQDRLLTLELNPIRARIVQLVRRHGKIGPLSLMQSSSKDGTLFYEFAEFDPQTKQVTPIADPSVPDEVTDS